MELFEKSVRIIDDNINLELTFSGALSLIFEWLKNYTAAYESFKDLKADLDLLNHFIELGNNDTSPIMIFKNTEPKIYNVLIIELEEALSLFS